MTLLSDEELAATVLTLWDNDSASARKIERHIDALTAQRDRARDIAVSLEQELAEAQAVEKAVEKVCGVIEDSSADQVIEERTLDALLRFRVTA